MEKTVKQRIEEFLTLKQMRPGRFEKLCGLSNGYLRQLRRSPTADKLEIMLSTFPEINRDWLLNGEGEMLNGSSQKIVTSDTDFTLVPLVNIDSVGGMIHGNMLTSGEQYRERLIPFTEAREGDIAIHQTGDSMAPGIPSGSILLIRNVQDWREYFGYGNVFVLWLKDDRRITKRVDRYNSDPSNYVMCHSFNPDYADEELPKSFIREVWKVIKVLADKGW